MRHGLPIDRCCWMLTKMGARHDYIEQHADSTCSPGVVGMLFGICGSQRSHLEPASSLRSCLRRQADHQAFASAGSWKNLSCAFRETRNADKACHQLARLCGSRVETLVHNHRREQDIHGRNAKGGYPTRSRSLQRLAGKPSELIQDGRVEYWSPDTVAFLLAGPPAFPRRLGFTPCWTNAGNLPSPHGWPASAPR